MNDSIVFMDSETYWSFALVNNRLAEIYYQRGGENMVVLAHCYIKKSEYKMKREKIWIKQDSQKNKLTWRNGQYTFIAAK